MGPLCASQQPRMGRWIAIALVAAATTTTTMVRPAAALNNGVGLTPSMGFNTWYV